MRPSESPAAYLPGGDDAPGQVDTRYLGPWLRLLWNMAPTLHHLPARPGPDGQGEAPAPWLSEAGLHLPAPPAAAPEAAARWLRAAGAHAAAHRVFSRCTFPRQGVAPITWALTGLLEDARTEALAARELPGLARLWKEQHGVLPDAGDDFETLMARLARALADPGYEDPHPWVRKGRALFWHDAAQQVLAVPRADAMRALASQLGHDIGQMRMGFNMRRYRPQPDYRDDNRWLWQAQEQQAGAPQPAPAREPARDRAAAEAPPHELTHRYPEWDYRAALHRQAWCTVRVVQSAPFPAPAAREKWLAAAARPPVPLVRALQDIARSLPQREASAVGGDEIDLAEAVRIAAAWRAGRFDLHGRPYRRVRTVRRRMAAVLLVDASASSADGAGQADGSSLLDWQCAQAAMLARAMQRAGWRVAVQAFGSEGRHRVELGRVLDFGEPWSEAAAGRLAGLRAGFSTRLGAVLRHATRTLLSEPADGRWILVFGDGDPHDIDVHDERYLVADAHAAVAAGRRAGVLAACVRPGAVPGAPAATDVFGPWAAAIPGGSEPLALGRALARLPR